MTKLHTWPPKPDDAWPYCYTPDTTDGTARMLAALEERCRDDEIEVKRTGGGVLCRRKKEAKDGRKSTDESSSDGADSVAGGGPGASAVAGDCEVTG